MMIEIAKHLFRIITICLFIQQEVLKLFYVLSLILQELLRIEEAKASENRAMLLAEEHCEHIPTPALSLSFLGPPPSGSW